MAEPIADNIVESAKNPKSVETDGLKITEHSILDQIAADKYRAKAARVSNGKTGFPFQVGHYGGGRPAR